MKGMALFLIVGIVVVFVLSAILDSGDDEE